MYSGSVSATQLTNHNTRYRMLMHTYKFLNNLLKQILRSSNHTYTHTNTCTFTWLHAPPNTHLAGCVGYQHPSLSIGCSPYVHPLSMGDADAPALHGSVPLPATPDAHDGVKPPWGCTRALEGPCSSRSHMWTWKSPVASIQAISPRRVWGTFSSG